MPRASEVVEIRPMVTERRTGTPVYRQVALHIVAEIESHGAVAGARLPSEDALAELFRVTRTTVRRGITDLVQKGLLTKVHGGGTYFRGVEMIEQPLASSMISFSQALDDINVPFFTQVLETRRINRPEESIAARLEWPGPVLFLKRLRGVDRVPMVIVDSFIPARIFPDLLTKDFENRRLFEVYAEDYGIQVESGARTFAATLATADVARQLNIGFGDAIMYVEQTARAADGRVVEISNIWFAGRHFKLVANLFRSPQPARRNHG